MNGLGIFIALYAIGVGLVGLVRPQLLFKLRHPISVTDESQLSSAGVFLYRIGGVFSILVGLFVLFAWA